MRARCGRDRAQLLAQLEQLRAERAERCVARRQLGALVLRLRLHLRRGGDDARSREVRRGHGRCGEVTGGAARERRRSHTGRHGAWRGGGGLRRDRGKLAARSRRERGEIARDRVRSCEIARDRGESAARSHGRACLHDRIQCCAAPFLPVRKHRKGGGDPRLWSGPRRAAGATASLRAAQAALWGAEKRPGPSDGPGRRMWRCRQAGWTGISSPLPLLLLHLLPQPRRLLRRRLRRLLRPLRRRLALLAAQPLSGLRQLGLGIGLGLGLGLGLSRLN